MHLFLVAMHLVTSSFLLLVAMHLFLVAMHLVTSSDALVPSSCYSSDALVTSSFLLLVAMHLFLTTSSFDRKLAGHQDQSGRDLSERVCMFISS